MTTNIDGSIEWVYSNGGPNGISYRGSLGLPPWLSGVRFLSEALATAERFVVRRGDGKPSRVPDHPLLKLLSLRANNYASPFITIRTWITHGITLGNGYLYVRRDPKTFAPVALENLLPGSVIPFRVDGVKWFHHVPTGTAIPDADVLHLMPLLSENGLVGLHPVQLLSEVFERAQATQTFRLQYFKRGTRVSGAIEVPAGLTEDQLAKMKSSFRDAHQGPSGAYGTPILPYGAKWVNTGSSTAEQSQLAQLSRLDVEDVCRILRLPPSVLYLSAAPNTVDSSLLDLRPYVAQIEAEFLKLLTPTEVERGLAVKVDENVVARFDMKWAENLREDVNDGLRTVNEWRAFHGLDPVGPEGDILRVPVAYSQRPDPSSPAKPEPDPAPTDDTVTAAKAALKPVFAEALSRVSTKTSKAFGNAAKKGPDEFTAWAEKFAAEQRGYLLDSLAPAVEALKALGVTAPDLAPLADRYASAIKSADRAQPFTFDFGEIP